jgi:ATP-dependent Clp protease ATP-binding subunit ClpC
MNGYNFTNRVRVALSGAREEAVRLRHDEVRTEHLLLALVREDGSVAAQVMLSLGAKLGDVERRAEQTITLGHESELDRVEVPYSSRAKKVLELAMAEARQLDHSYVGTQHLLLGLVREERGVAAQVLASFGITLDSARTRVIEILGAGGQDDEGFQPRRIRASLTPWTKNDATATDSTVAFVTSSTAPPMAASLIEVLARDAHVAAVFAAHGVDVVKLTAALRAPRA